MKTLILVGQFGERYQILRNLKEELTRKKFQCTNDSNEPQINGKYSIIKNRYDENLFDIIFKINNELYRVNFGHEPKVILDKNLTDTNLLLCMAKSPAVNENIFTKCNELKQEQFIYDLVSDGNILKFLVKEKFLDPINNIPLDNEEDVPKNEKEVSDHEKGASDSEKLSDNEKNVSENAENVKNVSPLPTVVRSNSFGFFHRKVQVPQLDVLSKSAPCLNN